jgi:hypothetical protein
VFTMFQNEDNVSSSYATCIALFGILVVDLVCSVDVASWPANKTENSIAKRNRILICCHVTIVTLIFTVTYLIFRYKT